MSNSERSTYLRKLVAAGICGCAEGTSDSVQRILARMGEDADDAPVEMDEIEALLADCGFERCEECDVWTDMSDLTHEDELICSSCRPAMRCF